MRSILVIEDSPMVLKILAHLFRQQRDFEPVFCATLAEAELMLETSANLFFAALVDLNLPDAPHGESVDLVLRYRLPCIVLSGSYDERRRDDLLTKGVVDYVLKESQYSYEFAFRLLRRLDSNTAVKILIAEDSDATRNYIRHVLTPHRYQLLDACDGNQALRLLQEQPDIDLLVVDHSMPGISGFELVQGADDFLRQPFCPEELNCRVVSTLERRDLMRALTHAAQYDSLTGLRNRRAFQDQALELFRQAEREGHSLSVAMLDLDHFKRINDEHGHASGDSALVVFAQALARTLPQDLTGRLGGEEFALVSRMPPEQLLQALDLLRRYCHAQTYAPGAPPLSFSAGVFSGLADDLEGFLHEADRRLYQAKRQGRGRTCLVLEAD